MLLCVDLVIGPLLFLYANYFEDCLVKCRMPHKLVGLSPPHFMHRNHNRAFFLQVQFKDIMLDPKSIAIIEVFKTVISGFLAVKHAEDNEEQLLCWSFIRLCDVESFSASQAVVPRVSWTPGLYVSIFIIAFKSGMIPHQNLDSCFLCPSAFI